MLPIKTLNTSLSQLSVYLSKFKNRLSTEHSLHLRRLVGFLEALAKYTEEWKAQKTRTPAGISSVKQPVAAANQATTEVMTSGELMTRLGRKVEGINMLEVEKYLRSSRVSVAHSVRSRGSFGLFPDCAEDFRVLHQCDGEGGWGWYDF